MKILIQEGIPIPSRIGRKPITSPITLAMMKMKLGDCIDLPYTKTNLSGIYSRSRQLNIKFKRRTLSDGSGRIVRIWRIK